MSYQFSETDLRKIPYNTLIEVPFGVAWIDSCSKFVDIELQITATCEMDMMGYQTGYQYGYGADPTSGAVQISYNESDRIYATNSTALFSVTWASRRLEGLEEVTESMGNVTDEALSVGRKETSGASIQLMTLLQDMQKQIKEDMQQQQSEIQKQHMEMQQQFYFTFITITCTLLLSVSLFIVLIWQNRKSLLKLYVGSIAEK